MTETDKPPPPLTEKALPTGRPSRWELWVCGHRGHVTYHPDEAELANRLTARSAQGPLWRCLRCGDYVLGAPIRRGPADQAPLVLRGKALRQSIIVRLLAIERLLRAILLGFAVWAVIGFRNSQETIQQAVDRYVPALRAAGINVDQLALVQDLEKALQQDPSRLTLIAVLLAGYAVLELIEAAGLWWLKRWGEYFAVVATSIFLPLEVRELLNGVTWTRAAAFIINVAAVLYLVISKRLFGIRGGRAAYDTDRRGEQLLEVKHRALST